MPGYGTLDAAEGTGLLPWTWAVEHLAESHDYWLATIGDGGRPHVMPVWGVWMGDALWFSSGLRSRKARNLDADDRCSVTTDDPRNPVVVEGRARRCTDAREIETFATAVDRKYGTDYGAGFYDPATNGVYRVTVERAFGLLESDFTGSPTRWTLG
jgi:PPOX class probable F420-dependent enzyme